MKSRESFASFIERTRSEAYDWPNSPEKLDEYLLNFESSKSNQQGHSARVSAVIQMIDDCRTSELRTGKQKQLWDDLGEIQGCGSTRPLDIDEIVRDAYLEVYDGLSMDRVVADPDKNCLFIQACWSRGIQASQFELNKLLLNARKSNKIGKVEGVKPFRVPRDVMDQYEFASEVAVRLLQEREHYLNHRWVSLDDILCDPKLGKLFLELATSITPGFTASDYRWAALSVRKAINRGGNEDIIDRPSFEFLGSRERIRASKVPRDAGLFWLKAQNASFYIGHSGDLRSQVERLLDENLEETLASYNAYSLFESGPLTFSVAKVPSLPVSKRNLLKRKLVCESEPLLNIVKHGGKAVA